MKQNFCKNDSIWLLGCFFFAIAEIIQKWTSFLGDIIEYDEETNTINSLDPFRKLTESQMNQINYIYQQYMKILNGQPNFDLIIQSLSGCSNTDEMKKILKQISLKDNSFDERINAEIILKSIRNQIIMRNQQMNNTNGLKR